MRKIDKEMLAAIDKKVAWKSGREPVLNLLANMGADVLQRDPQDVPAMILLTIAIAGIEDMERKVSACVN